MIRKIILVAPFLAPIPTAWVVGAAAFNRLMWPWPVALAAGIVVEVVNFAVTATALDLYAYNQSKRKSDPPAPTWLAVVLVGMYLVAVVVLSVLIELRHDLVVYAPVIFPLLSVAGTTTAALRLAHDARLAAIVEAKAERRAERQLERKPVKGVKPVNGTPKLDASSERLLILYNIDKPNFSPTVAARELGVSRQTVYNRLHRLRQAGLLNGGSDEHVH